MSFNWLKKRREKRAEFDTIMNFIFYFKKRGILERILLFRHVLLTLSISALKNEYKFQRENSPHCKKKERKKKMKIIFAL